MRAAICVLGYACYDMRAVIYVLRYSLQAMTLLLAATPSLGCKLPASARIPTTPYTAVVHSLLRLSPPEARTDTSSTEPAARRCPYYRPRLPTREQGRHPKNAENGSCPGHSSSGSQAASPGQDTPHPVRRPPSGNGSARSAQALPPLPRVTLRENRGHGITPQPAQQPAVAYIHRAHA